VGLLVYLTEILAEDLVKGGLYRLHTLFSTGDKCEVPPMRASLVHPLTASSQNPRSAIVYSKKQRGTVTEPSCRHASRWWRREQQAASQNCCGKVSLYTHKFTDAQSSFWVKSRTEEDMGQFSEVQLTKLPEFLK